MSAITSSFWELISVERLNLSANRYRRPRAGEDMLFHISKGEGGQRGPTQARRTFEHAITGRIIDIPLLVARIDIPLREVIKRVLGKDGIGS
jgi:hypothetical protein